MSNTTPCSFGIPAVLEAPCSGANRLGTAEAMAFRSRRMCELGQARRSPRRFEAITPCRVAQPAQGKSLRDLGARMGSKATYWIERAGDVQVCGGIGRKGLRQGTRRTSRLALFPKGSILVRGPAGKRPEVVREALAVYGVFPQLPCPLAFLHSSLVPP